MPSPSFTSTVCPEFRLCICAPTVAVTPWATYTVEVPPGKRIFAAWAARCPDTTVAEALNTKPPRLNEVSFSISTVTALLKTATSSAPGTPAGDQLESTFQSPLSGPTYVFSAAKQEPARRIAPSNLCLIMPSSFHNAPGTNTPCSKIENILPHFGPLHNIYHDPQDFLFKTILSIL